MNRKTFEALVEKELASLPAWVRKNLDNLAVVVEDRDPKEDLLGLFEGPNRLEREPGGMDAPSRVVLYRLAIEEEAEGDAELARVVRETMAHEIGHYFGMSEEEIGVFEEEWARKATRPSS